MSPNVFNKPSSRPSAPGKDGSSALDREAKHVENIIQSDDRDREDDHAKAEGTLKEEQDTRFKTMKKQAKEAG